MGNPLQIEVSIDLHKVMAGLKRAGRIDTRRVLAELRRPMAADQTAHALAQSGPAGAWQGLAATTRKRYARSGARRNRKILGRLPFARRTSVTAKQLRMYSPVRWSMVHQAGGRGGHGARISQRQFFYLSSSFVKKAQGHFASRLLAAWRRP